MKLSVIIPVYGVEDTLNRCVESVVGQNVDGMEIILIDDGSPDRCPQMCDEWAKMGAAHDACPPSSGSCPKIIVVHKQNGGLSDARNAGLDVATGDFVTFVDSDDFLATGTYSAVMPTARENDITEYPIFRHYGAPWQTVVRPGNTTFSDGRDYWLRGRVYEHSYVCNKIFRRKLFDGVHFPVGKVFEDVATLPLLLRNARRIATVDEGLYYYCMNGQGITVTARGEQLKMLLDAHLTVMRSGQIRGNAPDFDDQWIDDRYYMHVLNIQSDVCELTDLPPTLSLRRVSPLAAGLTKGQRIKALALLLMGMERTCKLNKTLHRWKRPNH